VGAEEGRGPGRVVAPLEPDPVPEGGGPGAEVGEVAMKRRSVEGGASKGAAGTGKG
jgi:hypothetical protein